MSETSIVTYAPRTDCDTSRICTIAEAVSLLEGLHAAYQELSRERRQQIRSLIRDVVKSGLGQVYGERSGPTCLAMGPRVGCND
jgi:hypothetical protein